jgi:beta-N-acetylhexosaminidase
MSDSVSAAARLFAIGFKGTEPTPFFRDLVNKGVSGAVLFAQNLPESDKVQEVTARVKAASNGRPLLLCVDQEGGRVQRCRGVYTSVPSMRSIGSTGDLSLATAAGTVLGREMRVAGFDVNFAPDVDVDTNPANPVIASRSFGRDPQLVSEFGAALLKAMQSQGVAACAKHFPGHGDTSQDSHYSLPRLDHDLARLEQVELPPFKAAIDAGVASIMSAHVIFSPLDDAYPATMSPKSLGSILRGKFGFNGVVFSDDVEMKALANHYALEEQILRGVEAGIDIFLICHTPEIQAQAIDILARAIDRGLVSPRRIAESHARIDALIRAYCRPPSRQSLAEVQATLTAERSRLAALAEEAGKDPTAFK